MNELLIIFLFMLAGIALLVVELLLPTHGVIGVMGVLSILIAVGRTFMVNEWAGVGLAIACAAAVPFAWAAVIKIYPHTPIGRKMLLGPVVNVPEAPPVRIGQRGVAISGLRPMGVCEFDGQRVEAVTEIGMLEPLTPVIVTAIHDHRPTVRAVVPERTP
jgi:membrane-bound ClpP family serine protease